MQPILKRLHSTRRIEQRNAIEALKSFAETPAGCQAVVEAGGVPALLQVVGSVGGSGSEAAAEGALTALSLLRWGLGDDGSMGVADWKAAMLAADALPVLAQQLRSSGSMAQLGAASLLGDLCYQNGEVAAAAVHSGVALRLATILQRTANPRVQMAVGFALRRLSQTPAAVEGMLQSGAVEALLPLLLSSSAAEAAQCKVTFVLSDLAAGDEARGMALAAAGGLRALLHLLLHGSTTPVKAALQAINAMATEAPAVQAAAIAEGAIPAVEAYLQAHPDGPEAQLSASLLGMLHTAQHVQQQAQRSAAGSGSGSQAAAAATPVAAPATPRPASRRAPHMCSWCNIEAPAGTRFKKCAACQQVGRLLCFEGNNQLHWVAWLMLVCQRAACVAGVRASAVASSPALQRLISCLHAAIGRRCIDTAELQTFAAGALLLCVLSSPALDGGRAPAGVRCSAAGGGGGGRGGGSGRGGVGSRGRMQERRRLCGLSHVQLHSRGCAFTTGLYCFAPILEQAMYLYAVEG